MLTHASMMCFMASPSLIHSIQLNKKQVTAQIIQPLHGSRQGFRVFRCTLKVPANLERTIDHFMNCLQYAVKGPGPVNQPDEAAFGTSVACYKVSQYRRSVEKRTLSNHMNHMRCHPHRLFD